MKKLARWLLGTKLLRKWCVETLYWQHHYVNEIFPDSAPAEYNYQAPTEDPA